MSGAVLDTEFGTESDTRFGIESGTGLATEHGATAGRPGLAALRWGHASPT